MQYLLTLFPCGRVNDLLDPEEQRESRSKNHTRWLHYYRIIAYLETVKVVINTQIIKTQIQAFKN